MDTKSINLNMLALKYGGVYGLALIIIFFFAYLYNSTSIVSFALLIFLFIVQIGVLFFYSGLIRELLGGVASFRRLFQSILLMLITAGLISAAFNVVLLTKIDPQLPILIKESSRQKTYDWMEKFNFPEDKIEMTLQKLDQEDFTPGIKSTSVQFFWSAVWYAIIASIFAAIFKRKDEMNHY